MTLEAFAVWSEIFGSFAVIVAIGFGVMQVRHFHIQRRDLATIELVRSFQDADFSHAFRLIHGLPPGISNKDLEAQGEDFLDAALLLGMKYETMGVLIYNNVIPIHIVEELVGGVVLTLWDRLHPWVVATRKDQSQDLFLEWFEWLADRFRERGSKDQIPAGERFRDWKPER